MIVETKESHPASPPVTAESAATAAAAGLRYVTDDRPGLRRTRSGKGFSYRDAKGRLVSDAGERRRIEALVIPPAWTDVWICPLPKGHLQATGRDERGRKQYRYHPDWRSARDETKFGRLLAFGKALPKIRERVETDLTRRGLPREKVLAAAVKLLETTLIRVGNREYAKQNGSFGLTTLRNRHVEISGSTVRFEFRGKSGKEHSVRIHDRRLARVVQQCRDLPGYELFQYLDDDGARQAIASDDVNAYLREITGQEFSAKDFRTWGGTVLALAALCEGDRCEGEKEGQKRVVEAVRRVAADLGNGPSICRKYYIHPAVIEAYLGGRLQPMAGAAVDEAAEGKDDPGAWLRKLEKKALKFLSDLTPAAS